MSHEDHCPQHSGSACKILLVEDHPMFREHLGQLINRELGMSVCGEADNIRDAMRLIHETHPDIAIVDITLRGSSGLELIKDIKAQEPGGERARPLHA
jgi:YesN/AraC family two-component response regulator